MKSIKSSQLKALEKIVPAYIFPGLKKDYQLDVLRKKNDPEQILEQLSAILEIPKNQIIGQCRKRELVEARQIGMFITMQRTDLSLKKIAELYGGRDHSTACYARDTMLDRLEVETKFRKRYQEIEAQI